MFDDDRYRSWNDCKLKIYKKCASCCAVIKILLFRKDYRPNHSSRTCPFFSLLYDKFNLKLIWLIKHRSYHHIETRANQLTSLYMMSTLAFNEVRGVFEALQNICDRFLRRIREKFPFTFDRVVNTPLYLTDTSNHIIWTQVNLLAMQMYWLLCFMSQTLVLQDISYSK